MISSIADNPSLTPQQRKERISNFETLLEEAERALHFNGGGINEDVLLLEGDGRKMVEKKGRKKSFLGRFLRGKKKSEDGRGDFGQKKVPAKKESTSRISSELQTDEDRQDEAQGVHNSESQSETNKEAAREEATPNNVEPEQQQPSNIYIPTAPPATNQDDDEITRTSSIIDMRHANSEEYTASICSIRSLGTFEKDFINNIIQEQQRDVEEISVCTFEQDAGMVRGHVVPYEVGVQSQQNNVEDDLTLEPILSETTFERDARKAISGNAEQPPLQVEFSSNDNAVMMLEDDDDLSETTFEQDHKTVMTEMVPQPGILTAMSEGSIRSVSTFEKDAAARAALAVKIGRMPTKPTVLRETTSEGTFEKDTVRAGRLPFQKSRSRISVASAPLVQHTPSSAIVPTESATIYEKEVRKSKENNPASSQQIVPHRRTNDDESRFERDVSRNMTSHTVKIIPVSQANPTIPRINDLVVELSPRAIARQERQLARQRSGNTGVLSRFMCHCGLGEKNVKLSLETS
jgi:hypothetical protein